MPKDPDTVALTRDLPAEGLAEGDLGAIVHAYPGGETYEVEFVSLTGETIAVVTLPGEALRSVQSGEIAHVRQLA